jgi:hypothetical protein
MRNRCKFSRKRIRCKQWIRLYSGSSNHFHMYFGMIIGQFELIFFLTYLLLNCFQEAISGLLQLSLISGTKFGKRWSWFICFERWQIQVTCWHSCRNSYVTFIRSCSLLCACSNDYRHVLYVKCDPRTLTYVLCNCVMLTSEVMMFTMQVSAWIFEVDNLKPESVT